MSGSSPVRPPLPVVGRQSAKQEELLRLAYRLMAAKGMHRMTLQDVADAAGMSKANVVYHYKTKEDLVLTSMQWVLERVAERVVEATASAPGRDEKIRAMIDAIFLDPRRNRAFYTVYAELIAHSSRNPRFAALNGWFREIVTGQYAAVIDASDESPETVAEAAMVVRALIDGLFLQWLEEPGWEARHAEYKDLCVRSIIAFLDR
ncbi:MAG TPA: TetR/AcrR family transcriptional regulator [Gaiella sp.]|nr:TetR/AcrR family transcriptional regulator [Gaiella sp.]